MPPMQKACDPDLRTSAFLLFEEVRTLTWASGSERTTVSRPLFNLPRNSPCLRLMKTKIRGPESPE